jgi:hypothetical protein
MAYQVAGWCYATLSEAAAAMLVERSRDSGAFVTSGVSVSGDDLVISGTLLDAGSEYAESVTVAVPTCSEVGPLLNSNGLTLSDVVEVSWLVVGVWVATAAIKWLTRALIQ